MSVRRLAAVQPAKFRFTVDNLKWARAQLKKFPKDRKQSAVIPLLWRAQEQNDGWVSEPAIRYVAEFLDMAYIRVLEIATFYTMFNLAPVGRHYVQLCGTTPCWLRGAEDLKAVCRKMIGDQGQVTEDGALSWIEVECLGACVNAPMVQINMDYYEDLTAESFEALLNDLRDGKDVTPGPQVDRQTSAPLGGALTLVSNDLPGVDAVQSKAKSKPAEKSAKTPTRAEATARPPSYEVAGKKPRGLKTARRGSAEDLKKISGVGPKIEGILNGLGIFHFDQIAAWTPENVAWVDDHLRFKGRIDREDWISQAANLAESEG